MKATKWKKCDRKFNNNKVSFKMRQENLSQKQKNFRNFTDVILHERVFELIIHVDAKAWVFPTSFAVILSAVALPIVLKAEFNFELICTLPYLFSKVQATAFKSPICIQNSLESAPIALFSSRLKEGKIIHKKSLRAPFTLIFHSEAT